jgi:hypothetical protein
MPHHNQTKKRTTWFLRLITLYISFSVSENSLVFSVNHAHEILNLHLSEMPVLVASGFFFNFPVMFSIFMMMYANGPLAELFSWL